MNLSITSASQYVLGLLGGYTQGTVHSIYRKTINLSFGGQLAALQAEGSPLSPISLILPLTEEGMAALPLEIGERAVATSDSLSVGKDCTFFFGAASLQDSKLKGVLPEESLVLLEDALMAVVSSGHKGSFDVLFSCLPDAEEIPFLAVAGKRLKEASKALEKSCWEAASGELCRLIGLGLGLTPGGDDFLCGVLAGLILCGGNRHPFAQALKEDVGLRLADTNEISAAFLRCALEGQFSQAVNSLSRLPDRKEISADFSAIGHSSGMDTLSGILYLLQRRKVFMR